MRGISSRKLSDAATVTSFNTDEIPHERLFGMTSLEGGDKLKAWRTFSGESARTPPSIGEFGNTFLRDFTVGVKDIIDVAGFPTRCGSAIFDDAKAATIDAACVALIRSAGAHIIGKTVTTELATFVPSPTRNPRNLEHTPGGSSAGSAAAVADGQVRIAIGTQTAGSVLRPAAYCGVFGFKPSFDVVPRAGVVVQSETLDTIGVFARSVDDCAAWLAAMLNHKITLEENLGSLKGTLSIGVVTNLREHASADMRDALARASDALARAGHRVHEWTLPAPLATVHDDQRIIQSYESARAYHAARTQHRALVTPALLEVLDEGARISRVTYLCALSNAEAARRVADEQFRSYDAWLMPAAPGAAPIGLTSTGDPIFNRLASVLHTPAISIPAFDDAQNLPLGLQLIGRRGSDVSFLAAVNQVHSCWQKAAA
jgi:Asp-tRNA(Asn)/Glu-tRNA(Gln) amidotransferase A subunit family amidase